MSKPVFVRYQYRGNDIHERHMYHVPRRGDLVKIGQDRDPLRVVDIKWVMAQDKDIGGIVVMIELDEVV